MPDQAMVDHGRVFCLGRGGPPGQPNNGMLGRPHLTMKIGLNGVLDNLKGKGAVVVETGRTEST